MAVLFSLLFTLPWLALLFFVLTDKYGERVAYIVLSFMPVSLLGLILEFQQYLGHSPQVLISVTIWLSVILLFVGIALMIRAHRRNQAKSHLLAATIVASVPVVLVCIMLYQMNQDGFLKAL